MSSAHACDTDSRVVSFISLMMMVGSMYGGRSPISVGLMVSPNAALTVHVDGLMFFSLPLCPVPDVDAPLSMMTLLPLASIDRMRWDGPSTWSRFMESGLGLRSFGSAFFFLGGDTRSMMKGVPRYGPGLLDDLHWSGIISPSPLRAIDEMTWTRFS